MRHKNAHIISLAILLVLLSAILVAPMAQAQAPDRGTGPNERSAGSRPEDDGDGDSRSTTDPIVPGATVSGRVYNEGLHPQPGVQVIIGGGGWQAKTVTDSNGYYQFAGLGQGTATLNLTLPAGKAPLLADWPVLLTSGADIEVNLGYISGSVSHFPVLLSGMIENDQLTVQVQNRSDEAAKGGLLKIDLPPDIQAYEEIHSSFGGVAEWRNTIRRSLSHINRGETVALMMNLTQPERRDRSPATEIKVVFTYDQQLMPQQLILPLSPAETPLPAGTPLVAEIPQTVEADPTTEAKTVPVTETSQVVEADLTIMELIPITGSMSGSPSIGWASLPLLLIVGLLASGFWSVKKR